VTRHAALVAACIATLAVGCANDGGRRPLRGLAPCGAEGPTDALCGTVSVYENRASATGRVLRLAVVVLPALQEVPEPDPLFFLAGGPGQAAAQMAPLVRTLFRRVQGSRDIVLVDQRGTGQSHPLECRNASRTLSALLEPDAVAVERLRECLAAYDADVRLYTTDIAMEDLDQVREHLGYDRINLYGGSYGTRAALVYLRSHSAHVRAVVLDGVAPMDMRLPLHAGRDAQRALDKLTTACADDAGCHRAYPALDARIGALIRRLDAAPAHVRLAHPVSGAVEDVAIDGRAVTAVIVGALYSPLTSSLLPALVARAERHDFQGLLALALATDPDGGGVSVGMQLSVVCSEDVSRLRDADLAQAAGESVFGRHLMSGPLEACAAWPAARLPAAYYEPVVSDVPVLALSGDLDPVTPAVWAEEATTRLSRVTRLTAPATGHGVASSPCGARLVHQFITDGHADRLDTACLSTAHRPPFVLTPAGPDPSVGLAP